MTAPDGTDFQWYLNGIPVGSDKGGRLKELIVTTSGKYKVSVKLNAESETRIVSGELYVTGTETNVNTEKLNEIQAYPNPAFDFLHVSSDFSKNFNYVITDLSGKQLLSGHLFNGVGEIDIKKLFVGIYLLVVGNEHIKVIKNK